LRWLARPSSKFSKSDRITEAHKVRARIARKQHSSRMPQKRDLSGAMPRSMNNFDTAGDGHYVPSGQWLVDGDRLQSLLGMEEQLAQHLPQQTRGRPHRSKRTSALGDRDIERVHVGPGTGFPHDRCGTANMISVAVGENQVLEPVWRTAASRRR
jgi:hypothetical protein